MYSEEIEENILSVFQYLSNICNFYEHYHYTHFVVLMFCIHVFMFSLVHYRLLGKEGGG